MIYSFIAQFANLACKSFLCLIIICHIAVPYPSCLHILAMERFLDVYDKQFDVDAKDFFMESMFISRAVCI